MIQKEEITKVISNHGLWKTRLSQAIATGKTDVTVATVRGCHGLDGQSVRVREVALRSDTGC